MRADAARNRERVIETARSVFAERGVDAPLDDIARLAGVGAGTLYRHFPNRDALIEAVLEPWDLAAPPAPGRSSARETLMTVLSSAVRAIAAHHGAAVRMLEAMDDTHSALHGRGLALAVANRAALHPLRTKGLLRDGVDDALLCRLACGLAAVIDHGRTDDRSARLLVEITVDGLLRPDLTGEVGGAGAHSAEVVP